MWSLSLFVVVLFCFVFLAGYTSFVCFEFLFFATLSVCSISAQSHAVCTLCAWLIQAGQGVPWGSQ